MGAKRIAVAALGKKAGDVVEELLETVKMVLKHYEDIFLVL